MLRDAFSVHAHFRPNDQTKRADSCSNAGQPLATLQFHRADNLRKSCGKAAEVRSWTRADLEFDNITFQLIRKQLEEESHHLRRHRTSIKLGRVVRVYDASFISYVLGLRSPRKHPRTYSVAQYVFTNASQTHSWYPHGSYISLA